MEATRQQSPVLIPRWVRDLQTFRRWVTSGDLPEKQRISYFNGDIWVDSSMETLLHSLVKSCIIGFLETLTRSEKTGRLLADGMLLSHPEADLSSEPDAIFISAESIQRQRVQITQGIDSLEIVGSPDMVLEVVSHSSVKKDTVILPESYWKAGIAEYWLVDPRGKTMRFDLFRWTERGYSATRKQGGWVKSPVFGHSFRLVAEEGEDGIPLFTLQIR